MEPLFTTPFEKDPLLIKSQVYTDIARCLHVSSPDYMTEYLWSALSTFCQAYKESIDSSDCENLMIDMAKP